MRFLFVFISNTVYQEKTICTLWSFLLNKYIHKKHDSLFIGTQSILFVYLLYLLEIFLPWMNFSFYLKNIREWLKISFFDYWTCILHFVFQIIAISKFYWLFENWILLLMLVEYIIVCLLNFQVYGNINQK